MFAVLTRNLAKQLRISHVLTMPAKPGFYAVRKGHKTGVFTKWSECEEQVKGFAGARYKKFSTEEEAVEFVKGTDSKSGSTSATKRASEDTGNGEAPSDAKKSKSDKEETDVVINKDATIVYTDGCCFFNGKKGAVSGIGVYWGKDSTYNVSEKLDGRQTNNRAEIFAAVKAIQQAKERGIKELALHTDSQFMINSMTKWIGGWKKKGWVTSSGEEVKNKDDFIALDKAMEGVNVQWIHVRGHIGIEGNEAADKLANQGARQ